MGVMKIKTPGGFIPAGGVSSNDMVATQAAMNDDGFAEFKNSKGVTLYTLDLSSIGAATFSDLVVSAEAVEITEGGGGTFSVHLAMPPSANQPVYLAVSDNTRLSVSPATLTFTPSNFATPQVVTVTAAHDEDEADEDITVTLTSKKVDAKQLLVNIVDDDKPALVEDGLEFYINLRNMADQNSASTRIVDSVGGVVCTTQNVAFDDTSGFLTNDGLSLPTASTKLQYQYPIKATNVPNGYTYEVTTKGGGEFHGAGSGFGNGYAHKWHIAFRSEWLPLEAGLSMRDAGGAALAVWGYGSWMKPREQSFYKDFDQTQEHTYAYVSEADGSANIYVDGVLTWSHTADESFSRYNLSGTVTYKLPYSLIDSAMEVAAVRIYERALTADEVLENARFDISQRSLQTF